MLLVGCLGFVSGGCGCSGCVWCLVDVVDYVNSVVILVSCH